MRVAILGAGFAGLSVAWYLLHYKKGAISIDLFDPEPIGGGVSGLASGLLHPYGGKEARHAWRGDTCMQETHRLITEASRGIDHSVILSKGILRPAVTADQNSAFRKTADAHKKDTEWWDARKCAHTIPGLELPETHGGLYINEGLTVDVHAYLFGLWQSVAKLGAQFHQIAMLKQQDLEPYDRILIAMGPLSKNFPGLQSLPLTPIKGQILNVKWPKHLEPPQHSLISHKYLVMHKDQKSCTLGATFERDFDNPNADRTKAAAEILPKITSFLPALEKAEILSCQAGFRATTPSRLPLVGMLNEHVYFFTGLGSKGLLYHAWVGKRVARAMLTADPTHFPHDILFKIN